MLLLTSKRDRLFVFYEQYSLYGDNLPSGIKVGVGNFLPQLLLGFETYHTFWLWGLKFFLVLKKSSSPTPVILNERSLTKKKIKENSIFHRIEK